jgi:RecA-family ATPase
MENLDLTNILVGQDPEPAYLVNELFYQGQMLVIAGEPGVGKSFLQYHIAMCLAAGLKVLGRDSKCGNVLYFDEENSRPDLQQYLRWIWRGLSCPDIGLLKTRLFIEHFSLAKQAKRRFNYMAECAGKLKPSLIVIDTVTPCCAIADENDNAEASRAMQALRRVKESAGPTCTMILLKHAKFTHDPQERQSIRGAKTWLGEADSIIFHKVYQGRPQVDGLRKSRLLPDKTRAFGLRQELVITPHWIGEKPQRGVVLT